jgi:hypothetical protein
LVCTNRLLYVWEVEVLFEVAVWKRIRRKVPHIIFVSPAVYVVRKLDLVVAEIVRTRADRVLTSGVAVLRLIEAIALTVQVVVPLCLHCVVVRVVVVSITGIYGVVVVRLILQNGVKPAVADKDIFQVDLDSPRDILCILVQEVSVEDWCIVPAVALFGEVSCRFDFTEQYTYQL